MQVEKALSEYGHGNKAALKKLKKHWKKYVDRLTALVRSLATSAPTAVTAQSVNTESPDLMRSKLESLMVTEVHGRDVIERLSRSPAVRGPAAWEWALQLRFEYVEGDGGGGKMGTAYALQSGSRIEYGFEYQGNGRRRLVVTPLTERVRLALTMALSFNLGAAVQGAAGAGKTETVKDLGAALGVGVVVFNCSATLDHLTLGNWLAGLAQCGAWGCFDEFNRVQLEVLSVAAQQISCILKQVEARKDTFNFLGRQITLNRNVGIFVTMNDVCLLMITRCLCCHALSSILEHFRDSLKCSKWVWV